MTTKYKFRGSMAPVFTPFTQSLEVDLDLIEPYAKFLNELGIKGILVGGTTGEGVSMTLIERKKVAEAWVKIGKELGQSIMVQVGGATLVEVVAMAKHAEQINADAILCLPELFFRPKSVDELLHYLYFVSEGAPHTPLLYYHIPSFTGVQLDMEEFLIKGRKILPTLAGIKFTHTDLEEGSRCIQAAGDDLAVFLGADQIISGAAVLGFDSLIATTLNLWPQMHDQILYNVRHGKLKEAQEVQEKLSEWIRAITKHGSWVASMKAAMKVITGLNMGPVRPPLVSIGHLELEEMIGTLQSACNMEQ